VIARLKAWGIGILAVLGAILGAYGIGRKAGKDAQEAKQAKAQIKTVRKAREIRDAAKRLADAELDSRLRKYQRK